MASAELGNRREMTFISTENLYHPSSPLNKGEWSGLENVYIDIDNGIPLMVRFPYLDALIPKCSFSL